MVVVAAAAHGAGTAYTAGAAILILVHDFDSRSLSARNSPLPDTRAPSSHAARREGRRDATRRDDAATGGWRLTTTISGAARRVLLVVVAARMSPSSIATGARRSLSYVPRRPSFPSIPYFADYPPAPSTLLSSRPRRNGARLLIAPNNRFFRELTVDACQQGTQTTQCDTVNYYILVTRQC